MTHRCPEFRGHAPGANAARCMPCDLAHRFARGVAGEAAGFRQAWVRDLFTEFCGWERLRRTRDDMPRHTAAYARFFAALDRNCLALCEITQLRLIEVHGVEGLHRAFKAVAFLADRRSLDWDPDAVIIATERGRIEATVADAEKEPWAGDLQAYRTHLVAGRELAAGTARMYVAAAPALFRASGMKRAAKLTQRHLAWYLRRSQVRRNNLLRFLS